MGGGGEGWGMCDFTMMDAGPYHLLWQELLSCKILAACIVLPGENIENILQGIFTPVGLQILHFIWPKTIHLCAPNLSLSYGYTYICTLPKYIIHVLCLTSYVLCFMSYV